MWEHDSNLDLPALSADESGGNMTDSSTAMNNNERPQQVQQLQQQLQAPPNFLDSNFFYSLDQLSQDNPLLFIQQQRQQRQQQGQHFGNQFIKEHTNGNASGSVSNQPSMAQSIATSMESFEQAITNSVGDQPPSFWTGLNNFISNVTSNVTHNNILPTLPTFPNIARSFSEYLEKHSVPFLSSFNAQNASPISSPMPNNQDFDPILQFKQEHGQSNTGLQIRVLGVPQTGAKSRVETQIKLCIQLVTDGGDKAQWWSHLKLPDQIVTKDKLKKSSNNNNTGQSLTTAEDPEKTLFLQARVLCASDPSRKVFTCLGCIQRERKRSQRRKENKSASAQESEEGGEDDLAADEERILLFNCSEMVDFTAGDTILPTRITCYCRHHNERVGFCIYFEMLDHTGKRVAEGISPPIMITDDHKSNKVKAGSKRRRTNTESEEAASATVPPSAISEGGIPALSWIKSFQFGNNYAEPKTENKDSYPPISSASSISSEHNIKPLSATTHQPPPQQQMMFPVPSSQQQQVQQVKPPLMKRLIPNEAPASGGIEITILGTDFRPGLTIMFGDKPATNIQYWSPNTLICTLPAATQSGAVVVSFKESPPANKTDVMVFTYLVETDRALMELALQVVGMKMTGIVEDARKIAMRIVQGNTAMPQIKAEEQQQPTNSSSSSTSNNHHNPHHLS